MGRETGISWTDSTWNPIRGCSRVSEGCRNCYAEGVAYRFSGPGQAYEGLVREVFHQIEQPKKRLRQWNGQIKFVEEHLLDPLSWKKPRRIFVNSMSDLFHENVTDEMRDKIFAVIGLCPRHEFQILTKRPEVAVRYYASRSWEWATKHFIEHPCKSIAGEWVRRGMERAWLGVSVEDQVTADERIPLLLQIPSAVRFISAEPLLGEIDLRHLTVHVGAPGLPNGAWLDCVGDFRINDEICRLDWVIVGGESGPGARPMHPDWARSLRDQCKAAGVPYFFKQWGEWTPGENVEATSGIVQTADWFGGHWSFDKESLANDEGHVDDQPDVYRVGTKAAGCLLDGVEHHQFPVSL